jgi:hypothetical protein
MKQSCFNLNVVAILISAAAPVWAQEESHLKHAMESDAKETSTAVNSHSCSNPTERPAR